MLSGYTSKNSISFGGNLRVFISAISTCFSERADACMLDLLAAKLRLMEILAKCASVGGFLNKGCRNVMGE